jgi:hypothetical protein
MTRTAGLLTALSFVASPLLGQSFRTLSTSRQRGAEHELNVNVEFAAGKFRMNRDASGALYRSKISYNEDRFEPIAAFDHGDLSLGLRSNSLKSNMNFDKREYDRQSMEVSISPALPTRLDIQFAAGEAEVELGGLNLRSAQIKTGASDSRVGFSIPTLGTCESLDFQVGAAQFKAEQLGNARCRRFDFAGGAGDLTLDFTGNWGSMTEASADIKIGVGSLKLVLPRDIGMEVEVSRFLSSFDNSGFEKRGNNSYYSKNWGSAKMHLHLDITAALGNVEVEWR